MLYLTSFQGIYDCVDWIPYSFSILTSPLQTGPLRTIFFSNSPCIASWQYLKSIHNYEPIKIVETLRNFDKVWRYFSASHSCSFGRFRCCRYIKHVEVGVIQRNITKTDLTCHGGCCSISITVASTLQTSTKVRGGRNKFKKRGMPLMRKRERD